MAINIENMFIGSFSIFYCYPIYKWGKFGPTSFFLKVALPCRYHELSPDFTGSQFGLTRNRRDALLDQFIDSEGCNFIIFDFTPFINGVGTPGR